MKTKVVQHVPRINLSNLKFQIFKFLKISKFSNFLWFPAFVWLSDIFYYKISLLYYCNPDLTPYHIAPCQIAEAGYGRSLYWLGSEIIFFIVNKNPFSIPLFSIHEEVLVCSTFINHEGLQPLTRNHCTVG